MPRIKDQTAMTLGLYAKKKMENIDLHFGRRHCFASCNCTPSTYNQALRLRRTGITKYPKINCHKLAP